MTKEVVILDSSEQTLICKALQETRIIPNLIHKILHGKPVPEDPVVEILPEHKHPEVEKTSDKPF